MNYKEPRPANRYVFDYTGNEIAWWGLGGLILLLLDQAARRDDYFSSSKTTSLSE